MKFTDDEIIKSLECCGACQTCDGCPYYVRNIECWELAPRNALELVNRQKAEIERLNKEVDRLSQCVLYHDGIVSDLINALVKKMTEEKDESQNT